MTRIHRSACGLFPSPDSLSFYFPTPYSSTEPRGGQFSGFTARADAFAILFFFHHATRTKSDFRSVGFVHHSVVCFVCALNILCEFKPYITNILSRAHVINITRRFPEISVNQINLVLPLRQN